MKRNKKENISDTADRNIFSWLAVLVIVTFIAFSPVFQNDFTNWDDDEQILENNDIRSLSAQNIKTIFSSYYAGMYQPLTTLIYAAEYRLYGLNPKGYHGVSLIFHLLNGFLVFYFFFLLTRRKGVSLAITFLFALHPMNVEAVAWVSSRSTPVFTCFFFSSAIFYIRYIRNRFNLRFLLLSLFFFILALISKSAAVVLPLLLILIDYYHSRRYSLRQFNEHSKVVLEKIPFFLLSVFFGILTLISRGDASHIADFTGSYSVFDTFFLICHSIVRYIIKLLLPFNLSAYYPYPHKSGGFLPTQYYLAPFVIGGLIWLILKQKKYRKEILFGTFFFLINIFLVLKILPIGNQIITDRYVYIPCLGFFYLAVTLISDQTVITKNQFRFGIVAFLSVYLILFSLLTYQRTKIWKNSLVLWEDVLRKFPRVQEAWNNRGDYRYMSGDYKGALADYNNAVKLDPSYERFYSNRGSAKEKLGDYQGALADYNKAVQLNPLFPVAYLNRGIAYSKTGDYANAVKDYTKAIELNPDYGEAYMSRGAIRSLQMNYRSAVEDYNRALAINPRDHITYSNRGIAKSKMNDISGAIADFNEAIKLRTDFADPYSNRGFLKMKTGDLSGAINDFDKALSLNPSLAMAYMNRAMALVQTGRMNEACKNFAAASKLGIAYAEEEMKKYCP